MQNNSLPTTLIALALLLSGCIGGDPAPTDAAGPASVDETTSSDDEAPEETNETQQESAPNTPPEAQLTVAQGGSNPLSVNITINATDADGDELAWTLDADGDNVTDLEGTNATFPIEANFTYAAEGVYNMTLTVTDGKDTATATAVVNATAPAEPAGAAQEDYSFTGTVTGAWAGEYTAEDILHDFAITADMAQLVVSLAPGTTAIDLDYAVIDPEGTVVSNAGFVVLDNMQEPDTVIESPMQGDWQLRIRAGVSVAGSYTITATFS